MDFENIKKKLEQYRSEGKRMFASSSFQSHSIVFHIISRIDKEIPIYFINTGFLFPETIAYKDKLAKEFGLNIINTKSDVPKSLQKDANGNLLFTSDPDHCCHINKVQPLDNVLADNDVWINGVRADQSAVRKAMDFEKPAANDVIGFDPMGVWCK
jgi:phosphoadenosine phosphosulfate reductase